MSTTTSATIDFVASRPGSARPIGVRVRGLIHRGRAVMQVAVAAIETYSLIEGTVLLTAATLASAMVAASFGFRF